MHEFIWENKLSLSSYPLCMGFPKLFKILLICSERVMHFVVLADCNVSNDSTHILITKMTEQFSLFILLRGRSL